MKTTPTDILIAFGRKLEQLKAAADDTGAGVDIENEIANDEEFQALFMAYVVVSRIFESHVESHGFFDNLPSSCDHEQLQAALEKYLP